MVPPVSGIPQDAGILCLVLYHSFGKIRNFFRRRGRFFCGGGDFCLSNGGGCAILTTVCGRGGIGRLDGFRFHCHTACGFESRRPHHNSAGRHVGPAGFLCSGQGGSSHKWQLRCKCADPSAVFRQHAALFLHIRSTPFGSNRLTSVLSKGRRQRPSHKLSVLSIWIVLPVPCKHKMLLPFGEIFSDGCDAATGAASIRSLKKTPAVRPQGFLFLCRDRPYVQKLLMQSPLTFSPGRCSQ